ncbi:MAG: sigma-70 family RNA polymerase sigma factor [Planctomycetales bacterium]|nr:sigma-70 family RNA polymerase sigma factor [Planctomycetales bacterium]
MSVPPATLSEPRAESATADQWLALYDAHAEAVWRLVARQVGPRQTDVADVVQETFLAAARGFSSFDPARGSARAWLSGIARQQSALHFRRQQRRQRLLETEGAHTHLRGQLVEWLDAGAETPPEVLGRSETREVVRSVLAELEETHTQVLAARYLEGQSIPAIATSLRCSEPAVHSRLARARKAFRRRLLASSPATVEAGDDHDA